MWLCHAHADFSCSDFEKSGKIDVLKCKISRLSLLMSRPWRGPWRHVCGHTNHCTTIVHTFFKSSADLDMHPWRRFAVFWPKSSKLTSPKWAPKTTKFALWALELFTLKLCFLHLFAFCWHTGDNVRLSDVVKFGAKHVHVRTFLCLRYFCVDRLRVCMCVSEAGSSRNYRFTSTVLPLIDVRIMFYHYPISYLR